MKNICLGLLAILVSTFASYAKAADARPNLLLVLADNWAWPHASIYGDPVVKTPHFDRLARAGALFNQAYCQVPSCSPARSVIVTGQAMHRLREAANLWGSWPRGLKTYPALLEKAGYHVGRTGKGWAPGMIAQKDGRTHNPAGLYYSSFKVFLDEKPQDEPFCFWFGSHNPHQPWKPKPSFTQNIDITKIKLPAYLPDHPEVREAVRDYYGEVQAFDHELGELLAELKRRKLFENTLIVVVGDNGWQTPRGLANVYDAGTHVPMAIHWPGKVPAGHVSNRFISLEDIGPTFLAAANVNGQKQMTGENLLPLVQMEASDATLKPLWRDAIYLEKERHANVRAGDLGYPCRAIRTHDYLYVWNIMPERWAAGDPKMHFAVGPYGDVDNTPIKVFMMLNQDDPRVKPLFELGFGKRPEFELYDLKRDPDQIKNVAGQAEYEKVQDDLRARLLAWMHDTKDPRADEPRISLFDDYRYFGGPPGQRDQKLLKEQLFKFMK